MSRQSNSKGHTISNAQKNDFEVRAKEYATREAVQRVLKLDQKRTKENGFIKASMTLLEYASPVTLECSVDDFPARITEIQNDIMDVGSENLKCKTVYFLNELVKVAPVSLFGSLDEWFEAIELFRPLINELADMHVNISNKIVEEIYSKNPEFRKSNLIIAKA